MAEKLREEIAKLKAELQTLQDEADQLELKSSVKGVCEADIQRHIELLHQYNDLKDIGQMLFGKLAEIEGTVVKNMYARFGLNLED